MDKEEKELPEFIKSYRDKTPNEESYRGFVQLSRDYEAAIQHQHSVHLSQSESLKMRNRLSGENKTLDIKPALASIEQKYQQKALEHAKAHGYQPTPEEAPTAQQTQSNHEKDDNGKDPDPKSPSPQKTGKPLTEREAQREKFLQQIKEVSERNRSHDKERS